jgi:RNase H-like domain found in reverse transcriptase
MEIEYLRVTISHNSVCMDPIKVARVFKWPIPSNKKEVQLFLGFTNFYQWFIQDFFHYAQPLFDLTKKDAIWKWDSDRQTAFIVLKEKITSAPVLALLKNSHPFHIEADSSDFATGAVISQQFPQDDKWHLVDFLSKSLSAVEWNYKIHDKEMLAII